MALHWNVAEITAREGEAYIWRDYGTPDAPDVKLWGHTECLIWATMFVGLNRITDENWQTFAERLRAWETAVGCLSSNGEPIPAETVKRHVGLSTNASTLTGPKFTKQLAEAGARTAREAVARELRRAAEAAAQEASA